MRRFLVFGTTISCAIFATLLVRSILEERAKGVYLLSFLWGGVLLLSLVLLAFRSRIKR
jgi:O-antigen/teichoic acid export membrane protein